MIEKTLEDILAQLVLLNQNFTEVKYVIDRRPLTVTGSFTAPSTDEPKAAADSHEPWGHLYPKKRGPKPQPARSITNNIVPGAVGDGIADDTAALAAANTAASTAPAAKAPTRKEVGEQLIALATKRGSPAAYAVLSQFNATTLKDVAESNYEALYDAAATAMKAAV